MTGKIRLFSALVSAAVLAVGSPAFAASAAPKPGIIDANPHTAVVPAGQKFAFKVVARNVDAKASRAQALAFYLSNSKSVSGARKLGTGKIPSLPRKTAKKVYSFSVTIPVTLKPNGYRLLICLPRAGESPHCSKTIALSVRKPLPAKLQLSPVTGDFGTQATSTTSATKTFTVTNTGGSPSSAISTVLTGTNPGEFSVSADQCAGHTLAAGKSCTLRVAFAPTSLGARAATLKASATAGGSRTAALTGTGLNPAKVEVSPVTHDFLHVAVDTTAAKTFTVANTGELPSGNLNLALGSLPDSGFFSILPSTTCTTAPLAPGATCDLVVQFAPTTAGGARPYLGSVVATATPGTSASGFVVPLTGSGVEPANLTITPTAFDFGTQATSTTSTAKSFTVKNVGGSASGALGTSLTGTDAGEFAKGTDGCDGVSLPAGDSCTVEVSFAPTEARLKADPETVPQAALHVTSASAGLVDASLQGMGEPPVKLDVTPDHDFGSRPFGAVSGAYEFTVKNIGSVTSGPISVFSSGPDGGDFTVLSAGNTCEGTTLAPNATCKVSAKHSPQPTMTGGQLSSLGYLRAIDTDWSIAWGLLVYADAHMTGQMQPLTIDPESYDFANQEALEDSEEVTLTVTNTNGLDVTGAAVVKQGANANAVTIKPATTCGATLAAGASCQIVYSINPTTGGPGSAQIGYRGENQGPTVEVFSTAVWNGI